MKVRLSHSWLALCKKQFPTSQAVAKKSQKGYSAGCAFIEQVVGQTAL